MQHMLVTALAAYAAASAIEKRTITLEDPDCSYGSNPGAPSSGVVDGINYLQRHGGICGAASDHQRVSCDEATGIWVNAGNGMMPECKDVGVAADSILQQCTSNGYTHGLIAVNGGNNGGFFVEVGRSTCEPGNG